MIEKRKIVGVMGSGTVVTSEAEMTGEAIAQAGFHLLTGGGGGQMEAVARAFVNCAERAGTSLGIIPSLEGNPTVPKSSLYPNPYVEIPIRTHLPLSSTHQLSRNHINILTSDLLVVLYGSSGTISECDLARHYGKPHRLLLLEETERQFDCSEFFQRFDKDKILRNREALIDWLTAIR